MSEKKLKTCDKGHKFYKSSDCPTCPVCAAADKPENGFLARLSAPARSALEHAAFLPWRSYHAAVSVRF